MLANIRTGFDWISYDGFTVTSSTGEKFSLSFEVMTSFDGDNKQIVQVQAAMIAADRAVWRWGCADAEDTDMVLTTYNTIRGIAMAKDMSLKDTLATLVRRKIDKDS